MKWVWKVNYCYVRQFFILYSFTALKFGAFKTNIKKIEVLQSKIFCGFRRVS